MLFHVLPLNLVSLGRIFDAISCASAQFGWFGMASETLSDAISRASAQFGLFGIASETHF